ncbi:MAG: EF-P beta-lysylation protein EpmB, partial [Porticoccaceae bacterium]|nr:EF-P beta-lysylation protein EpmB [Porticoccaceae bacterium]
AVHCRYCFRRHFPYADNRLDSTALANIVTYIQQHPAVNEVILSGGDPLIVDDHALDTLISALEAVPQLKRLRIHTRLPVVIPARLTTALAQRLQASTLNVAMVIHCNHAAELDDADVGR